MGKRIDLTGQRFGRLTVIKECGRDKGRSVLWLCKCECGNEKVVDGRSLRGGRTTSCGCYKKEKSSDKMKEILKEMWQDEEYRQMKSESSSKRLKEKWKDEEMKWKLGYKGGITPISDYLRHLPVVQQWFDDSKQQANYTCELTGKVGGNLHTHHLKAFSTIVKEAHELHSIQVKQQVKDYTEEELHKLEGYVASWHKDNSNAVVLSKEVHKLFHSLYGKSGNTPEQFEEFRERCIAGEFKDLI